MAFLRNRAVNWINLHSGVHALAQGVGGVFALVFLLEAGVSIPATLCATALIFAGRFVIRPSVLWAAKRWGLKPLLIGGDLLIAVQYLLLARVTGPDESLIIYCLVSSVGDTFYWTSYHGYFTVLGDDEHRGHQISAGVAFSALGGIAAPLVGAWALVAFGPYAAFGVASLLQALSAIPLFLTPNVAVRDTAPGALRAALPGVGLFMSDGWFTVSFMLVWQMALFVSLDANIAAYGGAMALAALVGAVSGLVLGRHIDAGHGRRATFIAYFAVSVTLALRALSLDTPWLAVSANALGSLATCLQTPAQMTPVYNLASVSPCALRFHIASEGGWDIGCMTGCLVTAFLLTQGASLSAVTWLAFVGVAGQLFLLRRYYLRLGSWRAKAAA